METDARLQVKFREKWGFDMSYYTYSRKELIAMISEPKESKIRVLEVGCGWVTLCAYWEARWPDAVVE